MQSRSAFAFCRTDTTLPRELTGRAPEQVRCSARVVHVEDTADQRGTTGIGAFVERFEPLMEPRNWAN